jgi:hypothetical protein
LAGEMKISLAISPLSLRDFLTMFLKSVRALILALGRFEIIAQAVAKALERCSKQYRAANQLNTMGNPLDSGV